MFTKSSSPSRIATRFPSSTGSGRAPDWSVSQKDESRWLRAKSSSRTSSSWTSSATSTSGTGAGCHQPERREDAAGLGMGLRHLVGRLGVAHQRRTRGDGQPAVEPDVRGADHDRAVDDRRAVGVASQDRERGAVVAAAARLVLLDQPTGVLHGAAGDRRGVHRVAQHLARVSAGAAGQEVLGVDQAAHRLEERPEHLAALVADVAHHLQLLVDDHEELVDLLLVAQELQQVVADVVTAEPEGAADGVHPDVVTVDRDVPLGAGPDQVAVAGEEDEGPVGTVLPLEQPAEDGQRAGGVPVGDLCVVLPPDDEVGPLALADLVADDLGRPGRRTPRRRCRSRRGPRARRRCRRWPRSPPRRCTRARSRRRRPRAGCRRRGPRTRARAPVGTARRRGGRRSARSPGRRPRAGCRAATRRRDGGRRPARPSRGHRRGSTAG